MKTLQSPLLKHGNMQYKNNRDFMEIQGCITPKSYNPSRE